jgi:RNA polymerase sigma-70 factor (TIGR02960 family)
MSTATSSPVGAEEARFLRAARSGDSGAFAMLTEKFRREIHVHCYRMVASFEDAQDLTQEVFLRAWRKRETFEGRATLRAWLYRIATNACLDFLQRRPDRVPVPSSTQAAAPPEVTYLQPYPDRLIDEITAGADDEPAAALVAKETIELAFLVAIQHLPARQRAALILRDVLGWSAKETASTLETTVPSANSALQRARATMRQQLPDRRFDWRSPPKTELTQQERALLRRYMDAHAQGDPEGLAAVLREDLRFAMPPEPGSWVGRDTIVQDWVKGGFGSDAFGRWRCMLIWANRQPAIASYLKRPDDTEYRGFALDVLTIDDGMISEIIAFPWAVCAGFVLPPTADEHAADDPS